MSALVAPFVLFAFATWCLTLAGIAALQHDCGTYLVIPTELGLVNGFSGNLNCTEIYRYYWFIIALEFVVLLIAGLALVTGSFLRTRLAVLSLLTIVTLLYINMTDAFLSAQNVYDHEHSGHMRVRVLIAGAITTCVANFGIILSAGTLGETAAMATGEKAVGNPV